MYYYTMRGFEDAYKAIPAKIQPIIMNRLKAQCGWSESQWFRKKNGSVFLHKLEAEVVRKEFAMYNINAETGEYINESEMPEAYITPVETRA